MWKIKLAVWLLKKAGLAVQIEARRGQFNPDRQTYGKRVEDFSRLKDGVEYVRTRELKPGQWVALAIRADVDRRESEPPGKLPELTDEDLAKAFDDIPGNEDISGFGPPIRASNDAISDPVQFAAKDRARVAANEHEHDTAGPMLYSEKIRDYVLSCTCGYLHEGEEHE